MIAPDNKCLNKILMSEILRYYRASGIEDDITMVRSKSFLKRHSDKKEPPRIVPRQPIFLFAIKVALLIQQKYNYF